VPFRIVLCTQAMQASGPHWIGKPGPDGGPRALGSLVRTTEAGKYYESCMCHAFCSSNKRLTDLKLLWID
jgi:hypothetical protein